VYGGQRDAAPPGHGGVHLEDLVDDRGEVDGRGLQVVGVRQLVQQPEVADHPGEPVAPALDRGDPGSCVVAEARLRLEHLDVPQDRAQRVLQLVGDGRHQPTLVVGEVLELLDQLVLAGEGPGVGERPT
jgi:hypothetical protein